MKLHTMPQSPNSIKVMMLANHLGMPLEMVHVDLFKGESKQPEFLKMNPNGKVPVLQDGDFFLWESNAIMFYLACKSGNKQIWPDDPQAQADINRWMCWHLAHWIPACGTVLREKMLKPMMGAPTDAARLQEGLDMFAQFAGVLNEHLASRSFIMGNEPGLPDFAMAAPLLYAQAVELPMADFPHVQAWFARMMAMPAVQKAVPPMPAGAAK